MTTAASPADDAERDRFVLEHPKASVFHLAGWLRAVERAHGHAPRDLVVRREGRIAGVLPLMRCAGLFSAPDLVSVPYGVYGGPLGDSPETVGELVAGAVELGKREGAGRVELRCVEDPGVDGLAPSALYATFVLGLLGVSAGRPRLLSSA